MRAMTPAAAARTAPAELPLLLGEQLCFALYSTQLAMSRLYRRLLAALELTYPQYLVLLVLWEEDGQRMSALGERLFLDSATLTPLLKRMEADGLLQRRRAPEDERQVLVGLTARGRELKRRARGIAREVLCASECAPRQLVALRDELLDLRGHLLRNA
jgi:DNA-binding MarR family transcriptional regulator